MAGACVAGACTAGGACMAGETATAADGSHPTGMHSWFEMAMLYVVEGRDPC